MQQFGNLVRLLDLDPDFIIDLRYAREDNFTGSRVYSFDQCYIDINTGRRLIAAKNMAKADGYKMKVWDAYRPVSAQRRFWDLVQDNNFVAYPPDMNTLTQFRNSHMNGQCVDVTLTTSEGEEILMPSGFDDFTKKARLDCIDTVGEARKNAEHLRNIMIKTGFSPYEGEWWHFYDRNVTPVRYSDISFE